MSKPAYEEVRRSFDWASVVRDLGWQDGTGINLGRTIVDRHARSH